MQKHEVRKCDNGTAGHYIRVQKSQTWYSYNVCLLNNRSCRKRL